MKKIFSLLFELLFVMLKMFYNVIRRRVYFVSGTGIDPVTKDRKWFNTVFYTTGNILPIRSIEQNVKNQFGFETCIVTNFIRITKKQANTYNDKYRLNYNDDKQDSTEK